MPPAAALLTVLPTFLLCVGASTVGADRLPASLADIRYVPNEDSFYQEQYRTLLHETQRLLPIAIRDVVRSDVFATSVGLTSDFRFQSPILVEIKSLPKDSLYPHIAGTAGWQEREGLWVHVLSLNIQSFIQVNNEGRDAGLQALLTHETAHFVLAEMMGSDKANAFPSWLNEGLAQSVTDEGRSRVSEFAMGLGWKESMLLPCQLDAPVDAFAHGEANYECYPEYYLAVARLIQIGGRGAVGRMLQALRSGQSTSDAFHTATGKDYSRFQAEVDQFTADVITDRKQIP